MIKTLFQTAQFVVALWWLLITLTCPECGGEEWEDGQAYHALRCKNCGFIHQE